MERISTGEQEKTVSYIVQPGKHGQWVKRRPVTELGQRIVSATVEEFASKGVLGARVAQITRRAGTSDPAFYRYFAGIKQAALFIMSEYYWAPLNLRLTHYQQITSDPLQLFEAVLHSLVQSSADSPSKPWLSESKVFKIVVSQMRNPSLLPESMLDVEYLVFIGKLEEIIRQGQQEGLFESGLRPIILARSLINALHGLLMLNNLDFQPISATVVEMRHIAERLVCYKR
jgi:AcrR family transcriptional regulator